jgi:hypothetical protein
MGLDMYLEKRRANNEEYEEIAYWRKANQIREWFNSHLENGVAKYEYVQVSKEDLEQLLEDCKKVLEDPTLAEDLLPTSSGFFFGSTDYDEEYFEVLEDTVTMLEQILEETDFENEDVYYSECW